MEKINLALQLDSLSWSSQESGNEPPCDGGSQALTVGQLENGLKGWIFLF
jgi:hypothetical protein